MWQPCDYREWERSDFMGYDLTVCAMVRPLLPDGTPGQATTLKWVELHDDPQYPLRERPVAHDLVRFFAFTSQEEGGG